VTGASSRGAGGRRGAEPRAREGRTGGDDSGAAAEPSGAEPSATEPSAAERGAGRGAGTDARTVARAHTTAAHERPAAELAGSEHLLALLALLEVRVREAVASRRAVDDDPDDAFRGLYLDEGDVDRLLAGGWPPLPVPGEGVEAARAQVRAAVARRAETGSPTRLDELSRRFGLTELDVDLLVAAVAPDLDSRFEKLYGYLSDDVTRRRATIGLALELCAEPATAAGGRGRFDPAAPLVAGGLVTVEEPERPFLTRSLRVPDRVTAHLLGDDRAVPAIAALIPTESPQLELDAEPLARSLAAGSGFAYLRERPGAAGRLLASRALSRLGFASLSLDLTRLDPDLAGDELALLAGREARLTGAGIVAGPLEALGDAGSSRERAVVRALAELPVPVVLLGRAGWDPAWSRRVPIVLDAPQPMMEQRIGSWTASLDGDSPPAGELEAAVATFRLAPEQAVRGAEAARLHAAYLGAHLGREHLRAGARSQNAAGLERMARRIEPRVGFADLVLPGATLRLLSELVSRVRHRELVLGEWGLRPGGGRGQGVTALFAGDSGTGKTMSAEVVAGALGLDLYTINLATVVDKYVGETEKNLERIFSEVDGVNGVLLFDEADALFGKRSEVRDAHDRYANIEVAYLLQRIETFDGLAILATNLRANVDEAFTRRLDAVVDFPFPDLEQRRLLWERCLGVRVPLAGDLDLEFLAASFELSGGNIASIALTAAYLAAEQLEGPGRHDGVSMADIVRAVHREYRKLGRLSVRSEFGEWYSVVADEVG
jgi:hypothetical protein